MSIPHHHGNELGELLQHMPKEKDMVQAAELFSRLSDSTRLRILWLLCHCEECVADIAAAVEMSPPAVSHHLRILRQTGLIVNRREGKEVLYTLAKTEEAEFLHELIDDMFHWKCPSTSR